MRQSDEADGGLYVIRREPVLAALGKVTNGNPRGDFNLPDVVAHLIALGKNVETISGTSREYYGVNVPCDLFVAELCAGHSSEYASGPTAPAAQRARQRTEFLAGPILDFPDGGSG
jgi:bifunctional N-acetylglucosamine-1-phosphate-uridyltransferase/glucosamine-1-phosphate-acetyltransferase GlmU-like protein